MSVPKFIIQAEQCLDDLSDQLKLGVEDCAPEQQRNCIQLLARELSGAGGGSTSILAACTKQCLLNDLKKEIEGQSPKVNNITSQVIRLPEASKLTPREAEIFELLLGPKPAKVLASDLGISLHTFNDHTKSIYRKLSICSRMACFSATTPFTGLAL